MERERVVAFFDIGTNSVRLLCVRIHPDGSYAVLSEQKEAVRLGEGRLTEERLSETAMERAILVLRRFVDLARSFGAAELVTVATSATREASNQAEFLERLRLEAGLDVHVVSGLEEARLIYLGVSSSLTLDGESALFIDIGGGSTEIVVGDAFTHQCLTSTKLGSVRLGALFPPRSRFGIYSMAEYQAMLEYSHSALIRPLEELHGYRIDRVIGSSGTIQTLAEVAARLTNDTAPGPATALTRRDLHRAARHLLALPLAERRAVPGINPGRADIIVPGAAILETIGEHLGVRTVTITRRGLKEGLLVDYLSRHGYLPPHGAVSVRELSVSRLASVCGCAEVHSDHVRRLAWQLFDSSRAIGLHNLGDDERELLGYAARLHDIGTFLAFSNHHLHSQYIITNTELTGFDQREIVLIGLIARLHRKKLPGPGSRELGDLAAGDRRLVLVLAILLRLAESLDRTHIGIVSSARFEESDGAVTLLLSSGADPHLEVWGAENQARAFRKVFGRPLRIVIERG